MPDFAAAAADEGADSGLPGCGNSTAGGAIGGTVNAANEKRAGKEEKGPNQERERAEAVAVAEAVQQRIACVRWAVHRAVALQPS
jgi:hypothetical protein